MSQRSILAAHELRNASLEVLRGHRSGRLYKRTGYKRRYRASAPGEPPAVRSGTLRRSWRPMQYGPNHQNPAIESNVPYAGYMENGTPGGKIAPRPYEKRILEKAMPRIREIYGEPYDLNL